MFWGGGAIGDDMRSYFGKAVGRVSSISAFSLAGCMLRLMNIVGIIGVHLKFSICRNKQVSVTLSWL